MSKTKNDVPTEIVFVPGCFDNFDGTQEELNELMAEIQRMANTGELTENCQLIDFDELDPEYADTLNQVLVRVGNPESTPRRLQ